VIGSPLTFFSSFEPLSSFSLVLVSPGTRDEAGARLRSSLVTCFNFGPPVAICERAAAIPDDEEASALGPEELISARREAGAAGGGGGGPAEECQDED